ncbi:MAG: tRNA dihydrouridine synthase DusB [Bacteroidales bacterium]|nr:tRNA dihydrouridine synthase DusB [Bacteroidales bacterium]MDT8432419.1 tRNA dihydrouridine synthase DusB [Bacteroidales bacterium]
MKIGKTDLGEFPLFLAPMEDITDPSFRYICKKFGADMMYTEFISSDGLIRDGAKSVKKLDIYDNERPIGIQLYGHIVASMVEATHIAVASQPELIDINYGCPVRKIASRGAGAGMLNNIPLMLEMTRAIVDASSLPVTVKTRLGWDEDNKIILPLAEQLQDCGIAALTIHGRTRAQMYKGTADWTLIGEVKKNPRMHIPIIGNGDVDSPEVAREMFSRYGVDGIMIGRAAIGRPWLFRDIKHFMQTGELLPDPTIAEKTDIAREQFEKSLEWKSEPVGIYEMRRHLGNYFKGIPNFRETRIRLLTSLDVEEIHAILDEIREQWGDLRTNVNTHFWAE